jgi:hypothetical protein
MLFHVMNRLLFVCSLVLFPVHVASFHVTSQCRLSTGLCAKRNADDGEAPVQQQTFAVGSFVEFEEKKRVHIGTIEDKEHKSNGGARYKVVDKEGKQVRSY